MGAIINECISFGSAGDQWHYDRSARLYDLTRGGPRGFTVCTTQGREDTSLTVNPDLTALVIVDMQNAFLHPKLSDHPLGRAAVNPTLAAIAKCRELGIQVIWLNWGLTDKDLAEMPASIVRAFAPSMIDPFRRPVRNGLGWELGDGMGRNLTAGSWNAQIYEPLGAVASASTDQFLAKNRMSGMWSESQPLPRYLRESGHRTLLFAGVNTDQCVLGTLIDAYSAGWDCVLLEDCCATPTDGQATTVKNIAIHYGFVVDSKSFTSGKLTE